MGIFRYSTRLARRHWWPGWACVRAGAPAGGRAAYPGSGMPAGNACHYRLGGQAGGSAAFILKPLRHPGGPGEVSGPAVEAGGRVLYAVDEGIQ